MVVGELINGTGVNVTAGLSQVFSPVMGIVKAVGIVLIIYLVFLIVKSITSIKTSLRVKSIAKNVSEINLKLDKLIKEKKKK